MGCYEPKHIDNSFHGYMMETIVMLANQIFGLDMTSIMMVSKLVRCFEQW